MQAGGRGKGGMTFSKNYYTKKNEIKVKKITKV